MMAGGIEKPLERGGAQDRRVVAAARPMPDGRHPEPGGWNRLVIELPDIESRVSEMRRSGLRFRNDVVVGPGGKQILLEDPDGNLVELFEAAR